MHRKGAHQCRLPDDVAVKKQHQLLWNKQHQFFDNTQPVSAVVKPGPVLCSQTEPQPERPAGPFAQPPGMRQPRVLRRNAQRELFYTHNPYTFFFFFQSKSVPGLLDGAPAGRH
jgi:hypothetical protein